MQPNGNISLHWTCTSIIFAGWRENVEKSPHDWRKHLISSPVSSSFKCFLTSSPMQSQHQPPTPWSVPSVPFRATRAPCTLCSLSPSKTTSSLPLLPRYGPPLPAVHPCRLLNSASLTEEQTNKTPWGNEATSGNRQSERSLAYWCGIDHYWGKRKRKGGKRGDMERRALIWWSGLSCLLLFEWRKVTRQNPDQWLRQWDNHLSGHCAQAGGLDLTKLSHTMNRTGQCEGVRGVMWPRWPQDGELGWPSSAHHDPSRFIHSHKADSMKQEHSLDIVW